MEQVCAFCGGNFEPSIEGQKVCDSCAQRTLPAPPAPRVDRETLIRRMVKSPTIALIAANVAVFLAMTLSGASPIQPDVRTLIHWGANGGSLTLDNQWWRLLTSMFLHGGIIHLALNMWALLNLGLLAELIFGAIPFTFVYLVCGLSGGLVSLWWRGDTIGVGASGAIFGIAGALLPALAFHRNQRLRGALRAQLSSIALFVFYNLAFGAAAAGIDNAAHVGGLIAGILLGAVLAVAGMRRESASPSARMSLAVLLSVALLGGETYAVLRANAGLVALSRAAKAAYSGDKASALAQAKRATELAPDNPRTHFLLGTLYVDADQPALAVPELQRTVQLNPKWTDAFRELCVAQLKIGDVSSATSACSRAAQLNPNDSTNFFNLGLTQRAARDFSSAAQSFGKAAQLKPTGVDENYFYGVALLEAGSTDEAVTQLTKTLRIKPADTDTRQALAHALAQQGHADEAQSVLRGRTP